MQDPDFSDSSAAKLITLPKSDEAIRRLASEIVSVNFSQIQPVWVEEHLKLLCNFRSIFGNDLDKIIILAVIGQLMFKFSLAQPFKYEELLTTDLPLNRSSLINVESIAGSTQIPRETVRRKVSELVALGWIENDPKGRLSITEKAIADLDGSTQIVFRLISTVFAAIVKGLPSED